MASGGKSREAFDARFRAALEIFYSAVENHEAWPGALQSIADCLLDVGAALTWRLEDGTFCRIASPKLGAALAAYEAEGWADRDIRRFRFRDRGYLHSREPATDRHLCSPAEISSDPIYIDYCARFGLGWCAMMSVVPDPRIGAVLSFQRDARAREPYADAELKFLARIGNHVERALRLGNRLFDAEIGQSALGDAFGRLNIAVFAMDPSKQVIYQNPTATRLLGNGLYLKNGRLRVAKRSVSAALELEIDRVINECNSKVEGSTPIRIDDDSVGHLSVAYVLPVTGDNKSGLFLSHTRALVVVTCKSESINAAVLSRVLHLTPAEGRLAALVGTGIGPRAAAEMLGITEASARTMLKRVFHKTGLHRQSELAALLSTSLLN